MDTVTDIERSGVRDIENQDVSHPNTGWGAAVPDLEPFVDAEVVAEFLSLPRSEVLKLVRESKIRGYAYRGNERHVYRFRLSEVNEDFEKLGRAKISAAAPVSQRRKSNG